MSSHWSLDSDSNLLEPLRGSYRVPVIFNVSQQMKRVAIAALVFACGQSFGSSASEFELLGHFDNVISSDQGEHCGGYSLDLWESKARLLGLLHHHSGLCGDPPCSVIDHATLHRKTGRLTFTSNIGSETFKFVGNLHGRRVVGKLDCRPVQLNRQPPVEGEFEPDTRLGSWCSFWQSVPRCTGVRELCATLQ